MLVLLVCVENSENFFFLIASEEESISGFKKISYTNLKTK